jgi:integrase
MGVYKRGQNYYIDFTFHGERIREMIGPSRKGAEKIIAKKRAEIAENKFLDVRKEPDPVNFYDLAVEYLQWFKANKKPTSYQKDLSMMRYLSNEFRTKNLREITPWLIEKYKSKKKDEVKGREVALGSFKKPDPDGQEKVVWYVDYLNRKDQKKRKLFGSDLDRAAKFSEWLQSPMSKASVNRPFALLKNMFSKAIEWSKVEENPAKRVKLLKGETKRIRYLLPPEAQVLISNCADHLRPIVIFALNTGMRKGELLGLTWDQVNFDTGIISILETKNHDRRDIPMTEIVRATLRGLERLGDHVFCNKAGDSFANVRKSFITAVRTSGIVDFRFYDLRHTFASNLVMEGVDIMTVKELMGHKDLSMTLRYAHLAPNHKTKAINTLDRVMSPNPPHTLEATNVIPLSF